MLKKLSKLVNSGDVELRESLFRVILLVGLLVSTLAIFAGLLLENSIRNSLPICGLVCILGIAAIATFKYHKIEFSAVLIGVLIICVIFPAMFLISGGVEGGATVWFVLGILYIFLMFSGKKMLFFLGLVITADVITYLVTYWNPGLITPLSSKAEVYYDSLFAVIVVGLAVGSILRYQIHLFKKEREVTLAQKEELEKLSSIKEAFFTNISHEIRTPINTIIGLNEMIMREAISEEVMEDAENVLSASKMLLSLVNDLLDFSKIENGKMQIIPAEYETKELFQELVNLIQIRMEKKNLEFIVDIDPSLPSVLYGDEKRIEQVVLNILTNAVKYTQNGSVTLTAQGEMVDDTTLKLKISVADTGIGIKQEDLASLYDSFKRVDVKENRRIEGSGLGLSIVKQLMDLMGGEVKVDSIYRKGSNFTVILEQSVVDASPIGRFDYVTAGSRRELRHYRQSFEAPEARVLIVDDDEKNLMVASKLLRATKVQIDTAGSGKECLELTRKKYYNVILMDQMMPEMNGIETLKEIRKQANGLCREVPVIILTADASIGDKKKYLEDGFDGYVAKPVEGKLLEAEVRKFLPEELVEYSMDMAEQKKTADVVQKILNRKRKKIIVTSDCVSDLSKELQEKYDIRLIYLYIKTERGNFRDTKEIDSDNISRYMSSTKSAAYAVSAPVEEYETFYAEALTEAENVIHISMAEHAGKSYGNAVMAAKGFNHVHVIDSGHISGGEGLMVLYAADMAKRGCTVNEICQEMERFKDKIETSFLLPSVNIFYQHGYTDKITAKLCEWFQLHPVLKMRKSTLAVHGVKTGKIESARKHYIRQQLLNRISIDNRIVYITYTGCSVEQQKKIVEEVKRCIPFEEVIVQKGSVSSTSNSGLGTIGIAYITKLKGKNSL